MEPIFFNININIYPEEIYNMYDVSTVVCV